MPGQELADPDAAAGRLRDFRVLGADTTLPETPGMAYLLRRLRPRLEITLGERMVKRILVANPARALSFSAP